MAKGEDHECVSVIDKIIPIKFRQQTYDKRHTCVWLSACLLVNSVDRDISDNMIQLHVNDQGKFEWLDLFNRKVRSSKITTTLTKISLYDKMRLVKGHLHNICKVEVFKENERGNLTDLILNDKKNCIFLLLF